jgi:hypothetical protein
VGLGFGIGGLTAQGFILADGGVGNAPDSENIVSGSKIDFSRVSIFYVQTFDQQIESNLHTSVTTAEHSAKACGALIKMKSSLKPGHWQITSVFQVF